MAFLFLFSAKNYMNPIYLIRFFGVGRVNIDCLKRLLYLFGDAINKLVFSRGDSKTLVCLLYVDDPVLRVYFCRMLIHIMDEIEKLSLMLWRYFFHKELALKQILLYHLACRT